MSIRIASLMVLCAGLSVSAANAQPKTAAPVAKGQAVNQAIAALTKEFQAYQKDAKANPLREKSDYFKTNPSADATPDLVMRALEGSVSGSAEQQAYVKWQLLSGISGKFPDDMVKRALAVYRRAPMPIPHPGLRRQELAKAISGLKKENLGQASKEYDAVLERNTEANRPILGYRDELFGRLPTNKLDVISAGFEDVAERAGAGLNANGAFDSVAAGVKSWALMEGKPSGMRSLADRVAGLGQAAAQDDNKPYTKLGDSKGNVAWQASATVDPKKCEQLVSFLNQTASSPAGGLKFKD